jgi:hypothetical protein
MVIPREKAVRLLAVLQGKTANILLSVPARVTHVDIIGAPKSHYEDHLLAAACRSQLKARIQLRSMSLQEFAAAVEQLAHWALVRLPVGFIQRKATHAFIDGVRD